MSSHLNHPIFHDDDAARVWLESLLWPNGPVCPHCGERERVGRLEGRSHRAGLCKCYACNGHLTVTVGTVFERSKVPLHKWLTAVYLMAASEKGVSAHQLHRMLGVTYKTAWFMGHRLREAMRTGGLDPLGGDGGIVEADETYHGSTAEESSQGTRGPANERAPGGRPRRARRRRAHLPRRPRADEETVAGLVRASVNREAKLMTDESRR